MPEPIADQSQSSLNQEDPNSWRTDPNEQRSDQSATHEAIVKEFERSSHRGTSPNVRGTCLSV